MERPRRKINYVEKIDVVKMRNEILNNYPTLKEFCNEMGKSDSFLTTVFRNKKMECCAYKVLCHLLNVEENYFIVSEELSEVVEEVSGGINISPENSEFGDLLCYTALCLKKISSELGIVITVQDINEIKECGIWGKYLNFESFMKGE